MRQGRFHATVLIWLVLLFAASPPVIGKDGELWGMGDDSKGQLGLTGEAFTTAVLIDLDRKVTAVAASMSHTLYITDDGRLWGMGENDRGQLGTGDSLYRATPAFIDSGVRSVSTSWYHTLYVKYDGGLWAMGENNTGQLGLGDVVRHLSPARIATDVRLAAAGYGHSLFLKNDGTLWGMGVGKHGRLGVGDESTHLLPVMIDEGVRAAVAGFAHSLYLKNDGSLFAMGYNLPGAMGCGNPRKYLSPAKIVSGVTAVAGSMNTTWFIRSDGSLWGMGSNSSGQLGTGDTDHRFKPIRIDSDVKAVAAGEFHCLYTRADDSLWVTGTNKSGQLGTGDRVNRSFPVKIAEGIQSAAGGGYHSLFIRGWTKPPPEIVQPPRSLVVAPGGEARFSVLTTGLSGEHYFWWRGGYQVGDDSPTLTLSDVAPRDAGLYRVTVSSDSGEVASRSVVLTVGDSTDETGGLENVSTRGAVSPGEGVMIVGFVLEGCVDKQLLIRGVGPTLVRFGVHAYLADPEIELLKCSLPGDPCISINAMWGLAECCDDHRPLFDKVGAFGLIQGSRDALIHQTVSPGRYTVLLRSLDGAGVGLGEVYDVDGPEADCRVMNLSTRGWVGGDDEVLIVGLVVAGEDPREVLVRAVGPGLSSFGVEAVLANPALEVTIGSFRVAWNDNWEENPNIEELQKESQATGAFPLRSGSRDAALLLWLEPGLYTVKALGIDGGSGVALAEVYDISATGSEKTGF